MISRPFSVSPKRPDPLGCASWTHALFETVNLVGGRRRSWSGGGAPRTGRRALGGYFAPAPRFPDY
jgi:hypothetical protein